MRANHIRQCLFWMCMIFLTGCSPVGKEPWEKYTERQALMGTFVQIDVCATATQARSLAETYQLAWARLQEISWRMNVYDPRSDVSRVNQSMEPVEIGEDTYALLQRSAQYSRLTGQAFDITVWPLIARWRQAVQEQKVPSEEELKTLRESLSVAQLDFFSGHRVGRKNQVVQIDLGGVAKGYAADEAARILEAGGFFNYYIDAGGDVYASGLNCQQQKWRIGIQSPLDPQAVIRVAALSEQAMATSGNYEQYFQIGEKTYSHIFDPATGYPQEVVVSASVIAPTAEEADAYATALTVLGSQKGVALMERLGEAYGALIVEKHGNGETVQKMTPSFQHYLIH